MKEFTTNNTVNKEQKTAAFAPPICSGLRRAKEESKKASHEFKGELKVALTRHFKETIKDRVERDPAFREELLKEGVEYPLTGDIDTGKGILRDYINCI
jgi:hypothetical protein